MASDNSNRENTTETANIFPQTSSIGYDSPNTPFYNTANQFQGNQILASTQNDGEHNNDQEDMATNMNTRNRSNSVTAILEQLQDQRNSDQRANDIRITNLNHTMTRRLENIEKYLHESINALKGQLSNMTAGRQDSYTGSYRATPPPATRSTHGDEIPTEYQGDERRSDINNQGRLQRNPDPSAWGAPKLISPTYSGNTSERPIRFVEDLKQYKNALGPRYDFKIIVTQSLTGIAADWWKLAAYECSQWQNFEEQFIKRFWNDDIQFSAKEKLEFGWHNPEGKQKRLAYALNALGIAREIRPPWSEQEITKKLSRHFSEDIRSAVVSRQINRTSDFLDLLAAFDQMGPLNSQRRKGEQKTYAATPQDKTKTQHPYDQSGKNATTRPPNEHRTWDNRNTRKDRDNQAKIRTITTEEEKDGEPEKENATENQAENEEPSPPEITN